jgi:cytochrome oxidase assembly protein ShyY1
MTIPNNHLSYALTWFALAATLAAVAGFYIWRREAEREAKRQTSQALSKSRCDSRQA